MILLRAALARLGAGASAPTRNASLSTRTKPGSTLRSARPHRAAPGTGPRRRGDRLRRRQFRAAQAILSRRRCRLRGHQYLARHHPPQAVSHRQSYTRTGSILTGKMVIYPIIDDVDGDGNQLINWMAEIQHEPSRRTTGTSPAISPISSDLPGLAVRLARRGRTDSHRRPDPRIPDGGQRPGGALDLRPGDARRRRRPSDVSARLQRRRAGRIDARTLADCLAACAPPMATRARP